MRTAEVPLKTAELLRQRSYGVSLALMAVKPEISLVSCQIRYEEIRVAGTTPQGNRPGASQQDHRSDRLQPRRPGSKRNVRRDRPLRPKPNASVPPRGELATAPKKRLRTILFGPWTPEERRHYNELKAKLNYLKTK
ncbi:MAG: hypothetical protein ACLTDR_16670 [Adlercreutzia equolifaciens]